jgi:hypothetical protein
MDLQLSVHADHAVLKALAASLWAVHLHSKQPTFLAALVN